MKTQEEALAAVHEVLALLSRLTVGDEWIVESFIPEALVCGDVHGGFEANISYIVWSLDEMGERDLALIFEQELESL